MQALTSLAESQLASGEVVGPGTPGDEDGVHGPAELFRRVGADDWDRLRERYATIESGTSAFTG